MSLSVTVSVPMLREQSLPRIPGPTLQSSAELTRKEGTTFDTIHARWGKTVKTLSQIAKF